MMVYYIVVGIVFMFVVEIITTKYQIEDDKEEVIKFNMWDRLCGITIWPIIIIAAIIKTYYNLKP